MKYQQRLVCLRHAETGNIIRTGNVVAETLVATNEWKFTSKSAAKSKANKLHKIYKNIKRINYSALRVQKDGSYVQALFKTPRGPRVLKLRVSY